MSYVLIQFIKIGIFVSSFTLVQCEVFTAVTDLYKLLDTHENVICNLERYIEGEENRLNVLKRYLKLFSDGHEKMSSDGVNYVDNPINAFTLIKRLSTDFERIKTVASEPTEFIWDREMQHVTEEDLTGAAKAISRLQSVYKLNTTHLAEGNVQGVFGSPMTASDCYNLAQILYKLEDPDYDLQAAEWFEAAFEKLNNEQEENTFTAIDVTTHIIKSYHRSNINLDTKAYAWAEKLYALKPNDSTDSVINFYRHALERNNANSTDVDSRSTYSALCCGEVDVPATNTSKLRCSYLRNMPFLKLAPIKMEEVHKDPNVFVFHDVLSDDDFEIIKTIAEPELERARLVGGVYSETRIGKSAWLSDSIDAVAKLTRRTADFTGLSLLHAEPLQVLNYGIGGHYDWHYDAFSFDECSDKERGNRIATVLFYMSDVSKGGATVFAHLNLTVTPKKGSALFWENLHPSGERDIRTRHAACPVLYGSKWVSNIWIHEAGQELSRPCPAV